MSCVLLERQDFGSQTSFNSLRIVHGGLRYLQTADLPRFFDSVAERRWFLRHMPDLVKPLPCLMPLYGDGLRRPSVMRLALGMNDALSWRRNDGVRSDGHLCASYVASAEKVQDLWAGVPTKGLTGGAVWYDACVPDSQRLIVELIGWACEHGAEALNYTEARVVGQGTETAQLVARDLESGTDTPVAASVIINATGPWQWQGSNMETLGGHQHFSIAWNMLIDRPSPSDHALAVTDPGPGGQTYFLHPWKGRLLIGTGHGPWTSGPGGDVKPNQGQLADMLEAVNRGAPSLELRMEDVRRVYAGLLPAKRAGSAELSVRSVIQESPRMCAGSRFFSISGVKLTTARSVANKVLRKAFPAAQSKKSFYGQSRSVRKGPLIEMAFDAQVDLKRSDIAETIREIARDEAVVHPDDLILRRTSLGDNPERAQALAPEIVALLKWQHSTAQ